MSARRKFILECGRAAGAFLFMAACEQEKLLRPKPCAVEDEPADPAVSPTLKDVYITDGFTGLQLGTKENPYSVRGASEFDALLAFLSAQDALAVHMEGRFKTKGVYRWGPYASRNLGKWWAVDGDSEVAIDPDAITDVDSQPLYCLAGPAQFVGGVTTIGNHSALADRWKAARATLRTGSVLIDGDGAIERVTMRNFGALGLESFVAVVSSGTGKGRISDCLFTDWNPSTSDTQVTVFMIDGEREYALMEDNETRASGTENWVQAHTIYQAKKGLVRRNRTRGPRTGYYADFWTNRRITIVDNSFLGGEHGIQIQLSPTPADLAANFSHEDYTIGRNEIESRLENVLLDTLGPSTDTRFIRKIAVDPRLSLRNVGATEVTRELQCREAA